MPKKRGARSKESLLIVGRMRLDPDANHIHIINPHNATGFKHNLEFSDFSDDLSLLATYWVYQAVLTTIHPSLRFGSVTGCIK
jgi:hypothetical protein